MVVSRRLMAAMSRRCMTPESCVQLLMYKRVRNYHLKLKGCLIYDMWRFNDKPFAEMHKSLCVCFFLFYNYWRTLVLFVGSLVTLNFWWHLPGFWSQRGLLHLCVSLSVRNGLLRSTREYYLPTLWQPKPLPISSFKQWESNPCTKCVVDIYSYWPSYQDWSTLISKVYIMLRHLLPPANVVCAKVMFLHLSVILLTGGGVCVTWPTMHAPPKQPCTPPGSHARPPWQPRTPPGSHACPPAATHAPQQPRTPPRQPCTPPPAATHTPPAATHAPPWYRKSTFSLQKHIFYIFF